MSLEGGGGKVGGMGWEGRGGEGEGRGGDGRREGREGGREGREGGIEGGREGGEGGEEGREEVGRELSISRKKKHFLLLFGNTQISYAHALCCLNPLESESLQHYIEGSYHVTYYVITFKSAYD